jgi:hypothetical protein
MRTPVSNCTLKDLKCDAGLSQFFQPTVWERQRHGFADLNLAITRQCPNLLKHTRVWQV